jgi:hypothetical protein
MVFFLWWFGFEVVTAVVMNVAIFWPIASYSSYVNWRFGWKYHLHLQGRNSTEHEISSIWWLGSLKMEFMLSPRSVGLHMNYTALYPRRLKHSFHPERVFVLHVPRTLCCRCVGCGSKHFCPCQHLLVHNAHATRHTPFVGHSAPTHPPYVTLLRSRRAWQITVSRHCFIYGSFWGVSRDCVRGSYPSSFAFPLVVKSNKRLKNFKDFHHIIIIIIS